MWRIFREHHYLTADFNKASKMFLVYWNDVLVGMASCIYMPSGMLKYAWRQHRLVILPDYQGLGFGTKVNDYLAEYFIQRGQKYFIRTTHMRMNNHLKKMKEWCPTSHNNLKRRTADVERNLDRIKNGTAGSHCVGDDRIAGSYEYMGIDYATKPEKLIKVKSVSDIEKFKEYIQEQRKDFYIKVITGIPKEENEIELAMKELGVRTEQLFYRKNGELIENGKFKKVEFLAF